MVFKDTKEGRSKFSHIYVVLIDDFSNSLTPGFGNYHILWKSPYPVPVEYLNLLQISSRQWNKVIKTSVSQPMSQPVV